MVGSAASAGAEEDEVTALQFVTIDRTRIAQVIHFVGGTRDMNLDQVFVGVIDQPAAVEPGARGGAAPAIRFTQLAHQFVHGGTLRFLHPDFMRIGDRQIRFAGLGFTALFIAFTHHAFAFDAVQRQGRLGAGGHRFRALLFIPFTQHAFFRGADGLTMKRGLACCGSTGREPGARGLFTGGFSGGFTFLTGCFFLAL